jgi:hypothetical protein
VREIGEQFALLPIMREQFPAAIETGLNHRAAALESDGVGRAARLDAQLVEKFIEPPDADALSVFAPAVIGEIRRVAGQHIGQDRRAAGIIGFLCILGQIPSFEVEGEDQRDPRAVRPYERLALHDRDVGIVHGPLLAPHGRCMMRARDDSR